MFLFEKVIIVSKKVEAPVQHKKLKKSDAYVYKDHIQVNIRASVGALYTYGTKAAKEPAKLYIPCCKKWLCVPIGCIYF